VVDGEVEGIIRSRPHRQKLKTKAGVAPIIRDINLPSKGEFAALVIKPQNVTLLHNFISSIHFDE